MRLRVFDLNTPWFWFVFLWEEGRPFVKLYPANRWAGWWLHVLQREPIPDRRGAAVRSEEA